MSVIVKGMKMPTSCYDCNCFIRDSDGIDYCCLLMQDIEDNDKRDDDCQLIELPPHGDLIDRGDLVTSFNESIEECHKWANEIEGGEMYARVSQSLGTFLECSLRAASAPTIIEAEREK